LPVPNDPGLAGGQLYSQSLVVDPAGAFNALLSFTNGLRLIVEIN
jgi:hypothetical protein